MNEVIALPRYFLACTWLWLLGSLYFFANAGHVELHLSLEAEAADIAQTYYSFNGQWNEGDSIRTTIGAGVNDITVPLPGLVSGDAVRFDPGQKPGQFRLTNAYWAVGTTQVAISYASIANAHPLASESSASMQDLRLVAHDNDPQLIIPTPPLSERIGNLTLPLGFSIAALIVLLAARRRIPLPWVAVGMVVCCCALFLYTSASAGPHLPLYDDWRYLTPGPFNLLDGWAWLRVVGNDTYFLTNQVFDFLVLRLTNVDFHALRLFAVAILLLQIGLQVAILLRATQGRPLIGAAAVTATIASLATGAYWSGEAIIGYQQALPTLFGTLLLGCFAASTDIKPSAPTVACIVVCCLASGLAYISGGVLLTSLGMATIIVYRHYSPRSTRIGLLIGGMGVGLFALQFALVTLQQGSLLEHSHRAQTVFPTDRRFWIFFVALFGRAIGYRGTFIAIDALCTAIVLTPAVVVAIHELRGARDDSNVPRVWSLLALYAGLGAATYAAVVAFGRAGFAPPTAASEVFTSMGKTRFHFWPVAAMIPYAWLGWMGCLDAWPRRFARVVTAGIAIILIAPKSMAVLDNASRMRSTAATEREGARCVVEHLNDLEAGRPVVCAALTSVPTDLTPILRPLRDRHAVMYEQLLAEGSAKENTDQP